MLTRRLLILATSWMLALPVQAFVLYETSEQADRWNAEEFEGTGLHDGIQVGVADDFADVLAVNEDELSLLEAAVGDAFAAWENEVLAFDVQFGVPRAGGTPGPLAAGEIQLIAEEGLGLGTFFGFTQFQSQQSGERLLTNGKQIGGWVITRADITINADQVLAFRNALGLGPLEQKVALQRLLMHEIGHALGFTHPNEFPAFNYDTDSDPSNEMTLQACDPFGDLIFSANVDTDTIMSNAPGFDALFRTEIGPDERGGRAALYPVPEVAECPVDCDDINDADCDLVPDVTDNCPSIANGAQADVDTDGVGDACDNCTDVANADQLDSDADLFGNLCDGDFNQQQPIVGLPDLTQMRAALGQLRTGNGCLHDDGSPGASCEEFDLDGIPLPVIGLPDLTRFRELLGKPPGPSALGAACANGITNLLLGEECDDGNRLAGDGCSPGCRVEP